jgi:hypothetical protein
MTSDDKLKKEITVLIDAIFDDGEPKQQTFEEKRSTERRQVLIPALLAGSDGSHACIIRNLTLEGAKIAVSRGARLQEGMYLRVEGKKPREITVKWRRGEFAGVRFL